MQVQITENTSLLNFQNEKIRKFRVFSLIPTIKERLHENLPFILKDISKKLNIYHWEAEIYFKSEEHFVGMILNTRIF